MKTKSVPSTWLERDGQRLDCGPYMSGALEAKVLLERLKNRKERLRDVTANGIGGIFNGPRFARAYVDDPEHGVPFLGSTDILNTDLTNLPRLSKKQVDANPRLVVRRGWTLITCSGTIGRMAYARPDMEGMAGSQHFMRVVPDPNKIPPGYLYAYLSSKFGVPLVVGGTYGAIIQHIEPEHIADLPVPRLDGHIESTAHELISEAAAQRDSAASAQRKAIAQVHKHLAWSAPTSKMANSAPASALVRRMDAFHHSSRVVAARKSLAHATAVKLGDHVESVFEPNRGPRLKVDDPTFGVPFLSSSEVFRLDPVGEYSISKRRTPNLEALIVSDRDLLLPRSGQLGGIIGRAVLPLPSYYGHAASEHLVRVRCRSKEEACFLWSVLASEPGYLAAVGTAFGSSIPSLDCALLSDIKVPWFDERTRHELATLVASGVEANAQAIKAERKAVQLVEDTIEQGTR